MNAQQILALAGTIAEMVRDGKVAVAAVIDFLESKGADAGQLAKNRALLAADVADINAELKAGGAE